MKSTQLFDVHRKPAMKTLSLSITKHILETSLNGRGTFRVCMVAEALQEKFPKATYIHVDTAAIRFTLNGLRYYFIPTQSVKNFIAAYDRGEKVKPFKFVTAFLARVVSSGFYQTHPKGDNRTNAGKRYLKTEKKRRYATRERINGVCITTPV